MERVKMISERAHIASNAVIGENVVIDIYPLLLAHGANILDENNQPTLILRSLKPLSNFTLN